MTNKIFILALFFIISCKDKTENVNKSDKDEIETKISLKDKSIVEPIDEKDLIIEKTSDFLKLYATNFNEEYYDLLNMSNEVMILNEKNLEVFKDKLKLNEYFTINFQNKFIEILKKSNNKSVDDEVQNEDILSYDYFLISQEPEYYVESILNNKYKISKNDKSIVKITFELENDVLFFHFIEDKIDKITR
jgi:hypothetical protein